MAGGWGCAEEGNSTYEKRTPSSYVINHICDIEDRGGKLHQAVHACGHQGERAGLHADHLEDLGCEIVQAVRPGEFVEEKQGRREEEAAGVAGDGSDVFENDPVVGSCFGPFSIKLAPFVRGICVCLPFVSSCSASICAQTSRNSCLTYGLSAGRFRSLQRFFKPSSLFPFAISARGVSMTTVSVC